MAKAKAFLRLYNNKMGTDYIVKENSDYPDFECKNSNNKILKLEITLNESFKGDIYARLGRSNHKNVNKLKENRNNRNNSLSANLSKKESLHNNTIKSAVNSITQKLNKRYGNNTA